MEGNNVNGYTTYNPAMVAYGQIIPLHAAVSRSLPSTIINTIYSCYPGAKLSQMKQQQTHLTTNMIIITTIDATNISNTTKF
jgi:hypothetical protein